METTSRTQELMSFGEANFGQARLGDQRRTARLVRTADLLARHPGGSLPEKLCSPKDLAGLYHLMNCPQVTHESVLRPHVERTLARAVARGGPVLIIHDTTELDFTKHHSLEESLGEIGNGSRRGYLCHNSLAVDPATRDVLGLANQILHRRAKVNKGETQAQRRKRADRESRLWLDGVRSLPAEGQLIDVCDRGADTFEFLEWETHSGRRFVVRAAHNRGIHVAHSEPAERGLLHEFARTLPSLADKMISVPSRRVEKKPKKSGRKQVTQRKARTATLNVSAAAVLLCAPQSKNGEHGDAPLPLWIVRVWEADPPSGEERLEWFLWTNQPMHSAADALQVVGWYECRWIIEEYHKAKKTGCNIEQPQFTCEDRLQPMLALLSVVALTLLNLREMSRRPDAKSRPAADLVGADYVAVLSGWRHRQSKPDWTIHEFFFALARLGGHLNRKSDHHPGWLVLWRGWTKLQAMLDGAQAMRHTRTCA